MTEKLIPAGMEYMQVIGNIRRRTKMYGLLVWHDPTTFNKTARRAFSAKMMSKLRSYPLWVTELSCLPVYMEKIGMLTEERRRVAEEYLINNPMIFLKGVSAPSQSTINGKALVAVIDGMCNRLLLSYQHEVKFGIDIIGNQYKWDTVIYTPKIELWLEIKAQTKPGSIEKKLISNIESIGSIGSQFFRNSTIL